MSKLGANSIYTYKSLFLSENYKPHIKKLDSWIPTNQVKFADPDLFAHLDGRKILGRNLPSLHSKTNFFVLDFDFKKGVYTDYSAFTDYVKSVISNFNCPQLVFRSSRSKGIHCYFYISRTDVNLLEDRVVEFLKSKSVHLQSGKVELFVKTKNLRLPLGSGSYLLDQDTLEIENKSKYKTLLMLQSFYKALNWQNIYKVMPRFLTLKQQRPVFHSGPKLEETVLKYGIQSSGTTNSSLVRVCIYFVKKLKITDKTQLECKLREWIANNNNDKSKTFKTDRARLDREIDKIVKWALNKAQAKPRVGLNKVLLTKDICRLVLELYPGDYSRQVSIYNLFKHIKTYLDRGHSLIPISKYFLIQECNLSNHTYKYVIEKLQEYGYLTLEVFGNAHRQHCNRYKWHGPDLTGGLDFYESLGNAITSEDRLSLYSKHIQSVILKDKAS